ncbi:dipicolinic acid synthetase subunit A [Alkalihalophilus pseudofirmus]|uniref:dipicolinic acid synthetase subunit A n=1 Tax=Alkalihalobacterium alkalinitrilicum TaxID=427920 RepID=UPI00094DE9A0|nr:dipicolinic acid synthetase subunit A [Alkalihalobacterium alkalinitrilicum]OLO40942.1 dipicolinic acid synthetase subunit A [Alkalihalophilus pseudofirmus]
MLTGKHIVIVGGDARQLEIIRKLSTLDAQISMVGFEQLDDGFVGTTKKQLDEVDFDTVDALLLPVSGTGPQGEVETIFSNESIKITKDILKKTPDHCVVYTGITNDYLNQTVKAANRNLVKLLERDDIAIYNSIPTVEGTVMMAIQHTDITIHSSKVVVIGFGRVGMSVARTFAALGADVKVGARNSSHIARITEMGFKPFLTTNLVDHVSDVDICINTIPTLIVSANVIAQMPSNSLIIDLASKPGGTDFRYAEKRGIKALLAPGLPGIVAPKTAGQILANVLATLLKEQEKK